MRIEVFEGCQSIPIEVVPASTAEELERQLAANEEIEQLRDRINRLESELYTDGVGAP